MPYDTSCLPFLFQMYNYCSSFLFCFLLIGVKIIVTERRKKTNNLFNTLYLYFDIQMIKKILYSDGTLLSAKEEWGLKNDPVLRVVLQC